MNNYDGTYKSYDSDYNSENRNITPLIIAVVAVLVIFALLCALNVICLRHVYSAPTCTEPGVCYKCGKVGEPALGHDYLPATYTSPSACSRCGAVVGEPLAVTAEAPASRSVEVRTEPESPQYLTQVGGCAGEARDQGIYVSDAFAASIGEGIYCTFYTVNYEQSVLMQSRPDGSSDCTLGSISLPFNGYRFGTEGDWWLVRDTAGAYFYIYYPAVGDCRIDESCPADNFSAIAALARNQDIVVPTRFRISSGTVGKMYNDKNKYYAVNMYPDPYDEPDPAEKVGTFKFYNPAVSGSENNDSRVVLYGYYGEYGLFEHGGKFFWALPQYFVAG